MTYTLVILFLIEGEPTLLEGWYPRVYETQEVCNDRMESAMEYLEDQQAPVYVVACVGGAL